MLTHIFVKNQSVTIYMRCYVYTKSYIIGVYTLKQYSQTCTYSFIKIPPPSKPHKATMGTKKRMNE